MELDILFKNKIDALLDGYTLSSLKEVSFSIIDSYKNENKLSPVIDNELKAKIYAVTRMPATYKVASEVFNHLFEIYDKEIITVLDVGAGLGAASKALCDIKEVSHIDLFEKEEAMRNLATSLYKDEDINQRLHFQAFDITKDNIDNKYDLVMSSYVANELKKEDRLSLFNKMVDATNDLVVVIEPGTPYGSSIIQEVRETLLKKGLHIIAPCPHENICPMHKDDWCHFSTRLQRSKLHKSLKEGEAPFEDEKYSYIVFSKKHNNSRCSRILRHPINLKGLIKLEVCNKEGLTNLEIRKNHPQFKMIKKLKVGDKF